MRASVVIIVCVLGVSLCNEHPDFDGSQIHSKIHADDEDDSHLQLPEEEQHKWHSLSSEERAQAMDKFFKSIDANDDGAISREEVKQAIEAKMLREEREYALQDFNDEVADEESGQLPLEKVMQGMMEADEEEHQNEQHLASERRRLEAADLDQDGFLSVDEYPAYYSPFHHPHMHAYLADVSMADFDSDHNGILTKVEFQVLGIKETPHENNELFEKFDTDNDGALTKEEFVKFIVQEMEGASDEEVSEIFNAVDTNKDASLSREEMDQNVDRFLKSGLEDSLIQHTEL